MMAEYIVMIDEKRKVGDPKIDPLAYLYSLPALEEIIRCRDCKHFRDVPMADGSTGHRCSGVFAFVEPTPDGFCAWAERDETC